MPLDTGDVTIGPDGIATGTGLAKLIYDALADEHDAFPHQLPAPNTPGAQESLAKLARGIAQPIAIAVNDGVEVTANPGQVLGNELDAGTPNVAHPLTPAELNAIVGSVALHLVQYLGFGPDPASVSVGDIRGDGPFAIVSNDHMQIGSLGPEGVSTIAPFGPVNEVGTTLDFEATAGAAALAATAGIDLAPGANEAVRIASGLIRLVERAAGIALAAGQALFFAKNDTPNNPYFRDDTNVDRKILTAPAALTELATIAAARVLGLQVDASGPAAPVELTGAELAELYRLGTIQNVNLTAGTTDNLVINPDTTVIRFNPTGKQIVTGMTGGTAGRPIYMENVAADGNTVALASNTGSLAANQYRTPSGLPFVLGFREGTLGRWDSTNGDWRVYGAGKQRPVQTVTPSPGDFTLTLDADASVVIINTTGDTRLQTIIGGVNNREISIEHVRTSGTGDLRLQHQSALGTAGSADMLLPDGVDLVGGDRWGVRLRMRSSFWRVDASSHGTQLTVVERAAGLTVAAGRAHFFAKNDTPNNPYFRDDTNVDRKILTAPAALTELATIAAARVLGNPFTASGAAAPIALTGQQLGEIVRFFTGVDETRAAGTHEDVAVSAGPNWRITASGAGDMIIGGILLAGSNTGGSFIRFFWRGLTGGGRMIFKNESAGSTASNRLTTGTNADLVFEAPFGSIDLQFVGSRWIPRWQLLGSGSLLDGGVSLPKIASQAEATVLLRAIGAGAGSPTAGTAAQLRAILQTAGITELEETGAGPFNDYNPAGARHIMASNAAGVFTGVASSGFVVGDEVVFSHQGTGYTEFQHNTGSSLVNRFFTGRQGLNLRIFDNELAVFRLVDVTTGVTTDLRWELMSPQFPFAHSSVNANGDVQVHNGTNWVTVAGFQTTSTINLTPSGALGVVDITALASGGSVTLQPTAAFNIDGFTAKPEGFTFDLIYRDTTTHAGTLNENAGNTTTSIRNPGQLPYAFSTQQLIRMRYQNARWRAHPTTFVGARGQVITVTPGGGSAAGGVYLEADLAIAPTTTNIAFDILAAGDVQIASLPDSPGRRLVLSKTQGGTTERIVLLHFSALEASSVKRFAIPRETSALVIARRLETREFVNYAPTNSGGRFWVLTDGMGGRENYLDNAAGDIMVHSGSEWSKVNLSVQGTALGRPAAGGTGVPVALTGLQQGQNLRRGTVVTDAVTTGNVATYALAEDTTHVIFTGTGTITLQGATIIAGKPITWAVDVGATVVVTFVHDGAPTITQERFRGPSGQNVTLRAGEALTTTHAFNRHRIDSVVKRIDVELIAPVLNNLGLPFCIPVVLTAGVAGTADDVTVFNANCPYALEIIRTDVRVTTALAGTLEGRSAAAGGGTALTDTFSTAAVGLAAITAALGAIATIALNGSLFARRSDRGVAGKVYFWALRT